MLILGIVLPTLTTYVYFFALAGYSDTIQKLAMAAGKGVQFALPVVWFLARRRSRDLSSWGPAETKTESSAKPLGFGIAWLTGIIIFVGMLGLYHCVLKQYPAMQSAAEAVRAKVSQLGFATPTAFIGLSAFYVILHSFLEEFYWRWFVFGGLRSYCSTTTAIVISSLGFMSHHVLVLANYFGWTHPTTYLFSICVAVAGALWAWMFHRSGRLGAPWLSHALADAAIFTVGFDMIRSAL
jgi:membrane protease YdiL (CAAX protease family)